MEFLHVNPLKSTRKKKKAYNQRHRLTVKVRMQGRIQELLSDLLPQKMDETLAGRSKDLELNKPNQFINNESPVIKTQTIRNS